MAVIVHNRLLDAKEAPEHLSISRSKLYDWLAKGKTPSVTIDSCRLFDVKGLTNLFPGRMTDEELLAQGKYHYAGQTN